LPHGCENNDPIKTCPRRIQEFGVYFSGWNYLG
jgi:hypothetical protein